MLDRGITLRCVLTWAAFTAAAASGAAGIIWGIDALGRLSMIVAALGFILVVLNDNAKTRRVLRIAIRELTEDREGPPLTSVR